MEENDHEVNESNYLEITLEDITTALAFIKHDFDDLAARNMIFYFHYMLQAGRIFEKPPLNPIERAFVDYVGHAFSRIVQEGKSPRVAFGLSQGRGEYQRENTTERDAIAAAYMILLMRSNWTWEDAKGEVANFLFPDGKGDKVVEKAYVDCKDEFSLMKDEVLMGLLPSNTPRIKPR